MDILKESAPKKAVIGKSKRYRVIIKYKVLREVIYIKIVHLLACLFTLIPIIVDAISVDELRANPSRYQLVFSDAREDEYVDNASISVVRYAPPYYTINAIAYAVTYNTSVITKYENTYFLDYNRSFKSLGGHFSNRDALFNSMKNNSGIKWRMNGMTIYNLDGSIKYPYMYIDPLEVDSTQESALFSPSYQSANYVFYKSYNMYFNPPIKNQTF